MYKPRHCEERSDEAIFILWVATAAYAASRQLAMTIRRTNES